MKKNIHKQNIPKKGIKNNLRQLNTKNNNIILQKKITNINNKKNNNPSLIKRKKNTIPSNHKNNLRKIKKQNNDLSNSLKLKLFLNLNTQKKLTNLQKKILNTLSNNIINKNTCINGSSSIKNLFE